jgi:hypothetical protein
MGHQLSLVSNQVVERQVTLVELWARVAVQWQIVWLYATAAALEEVLRE